MTDSLPSFVYPAPRSSGQSYNYNYNDNLNVSWIWDNPSDAASSNNLILWLSQAGGTALSKYLDRPVAEIGTSLVSLNFTNLNYPAHGHLNLWTNFKNGTTVPGDNSAQFIVNKDETAASQCHNCSTTASGSISSVSSTSTSTALTSGTTETTSSTSAGTPVATSRTPPPPRNDGLSGGDIAGIVIGAIAGVLLFAIIGFYYGRRRIKGRASSGGLHSHHGGMHGIDPAQLPMKVPDGQPQSLQGSEWRRSELQGLELQAGELQGSELQASESRRSELQGSDARASNT